jgi:anti-sigma factor RsiW
MRLIADEILMAYADDELEPKARGAVLDALTRDAEVVRRLDVFLSTRTSLARLYQAPMHEVLPQRFAALLRDDGQVNVYRPERGAWLRRLDVFLSTRTSLARLYQAPMHEVLPQRFAALLRDDGQVNVCRPERGAWLRRLKFFVTSLGMVAAPALSAAIALGLGTARMLHSAIMSPLNSPPNV